MRGLWVFLWRPHGDSNAGFCLRRATLYPLSYEGGFASRFYHICSCDWAAFAQPGWAAGQNQGICPDNELFREDKPYAVDTRSFRLGSQGCDHFFGPASGVRARRQADEQALAAVLIVGQAA